MQVAALILGIAHPSSIKYFNREKRGENIALNKTPEKNQFWLLLRDLRFLKPVKLNQVKAPRVKRQVMTNDVGRKGIGNDKHFHPSETVRIQKKKKRQIGTKTNIR